MSYNCKNYKTDGGDTLAIGDKLQVEEGAEVTGVISPAANVTYAAGEAPTKAEFDALIDALVAAQLMAPAEG